MLPTDDFEAAAGGIVEISHRIYQRGWAPSTSSNFSCRIDGNRCAITVSGKDKSRLKADEVMRVDLTGMPLDNKRPSAETLLHTQLYRRDADIGAVLHTHSMMANLVSMTGIDEVVLEDLEILKAFSGILSHEARIRFPVFDNTQNIAALAAEVEDHMSDAAQGYAYLIRGHGLYTWGGTLEEAMRHLETVEYLLEYVWHQMKKNES